MAGKALKRAPSSFSETLRELDAAKRVLENVEATALAEIASVLVEAAGSLSLTAQDLAEMRPVEWMTAEQAAKYLGCESVEAFQKIATREGIPRHYLSARAPRYNRVELDAWLTAR